MKKIICLFISYLVLISCNNQIKSPDISNISLELSFKRFETDFFKIDSNNIQQSLLQLEKKYPDFLPLFISNVLGLGPLLDTNQIAIEGTKRFLSLNKRIHDTANLVFGNMPDIKKELTDGFKHLKYYYPDYKIPAVITTIGPMDGLAPMSNQILTPNYIGNNFIALSLQFYLGKDFGIYNDPGYASSVAPLYRSRKFSKEYLTADVFTLVIDDLYPDSSNRLPLIERFIEKGKRLQVLKQFLPNTADTVLIGYTKAQLNWCNDNERSIYNFFTQQNLLYERDLALTQNFTNEGPFTQGMPETSPGNIGAYVGWQIVKSYLKKKEIVTPQDLMKTSAKRIFETSAYKPK